MYLLVVSCINGDVDYHGPFGTEERAQRYGAACEAEKRCRWHVKELIVPYTVVKEITWRNNDN